MMTSRNGPRTHASFLRFARIADAYDDCGFLGNGSFGQVRRMRDKQTGEMVAVKAQVVDMDDIPATQMINAESAILATLAVSQQSNALVRTEALIYDPPTMHIVMELLDNDLAKLIKARKAAARPFTNLEAWSYFAQLVDALWELHSPIDHFGNPRHVVLHRDVKPGNVLIDSDGFVKLGDFGLSKLLVDEYTQTACGTRAYMSPESLDGRPYSSKSDVYSLGCLMHELCSFSLPFDRSYGSRDPRRVPRLPPGYDKALDALVKRMISYNPDDRPSAADLKAVPQVAEQLASIRQRKSDIEHSRRMRELEARERALDAREHDFDSMRSLSNGSVYSERDASLFKREQELDQGRAELVENAKMLAERVQATNTMLESLHARLVMMAVNAGVQVQQADDRESILNALQAKIEELQRRPAQAGELSPRAARTAQPSVRVGASLMFDALQAKMQNFAKSVQDQPDLSDEELEGDPLAALRIGLRRVALNLKGSVPTNGDLPDLPGAMPNSTRIPASAQSSSSSSSAGLR